MGEERRPSNIRGSDLLTTGSSPSVRSAAPARPAPYLSCRTAVPQEVPDVQPKEHSPSFAANAFPGSALLRPIGTCCRCSGVLRGSRIALGYSPRREPCQPLLAWACTLLFGQ